MAERIKQKIERGKKSICDSCFHRKACKGIGNQPCTKCSHYQDAADVAQVRHGRCGVCSGKQIITQDCDNGYSLEIDNEQSELAVWFGDQCIAVFSIDYCPICGAKMECSNDG